MDKNKIKHLEVYYIDNTKDEFNNFIIEENDTEINLENDDYIITINKIHIKKLRSKK